MSGHLRCGTACVVLAISGGVWAANFPARSHNVDQQKPAPRFTLTDAQMKALFPERMPPYRLRMKVPLLARQKLTGFFDAHFRDPQRRAETCENMPKIGPSDTAARLDRQYRLQMLTGIVIPYRPTRDFNAPNSDAGFGNESLNLYLSCLQDSTH